ALIMVDEHGENSISVALGANDALTAAQLEAALPHLRESTYVLTQLETPLPIVAQLAELSTQHGFKLVLNPAPAAPLNDVLLAKLHLLTPNQTEAELLSGVKVTDEGSAREAATVLRAKGVTTVIITMGSQGAYVLSDALDELIPTHKVKAVDTTAAGDTFNGALTVALTEGKDLREAIRFANKAAACSVGILGAQASAPTRDDLKTIS
ncbi:MAG: PfkB family carbohydrate kinase, partial [Bacteroidota bacterium]